MEWVGVVGIGYALYYYKTLKKAWDSSDAVESQVKSAMDLEEVKRQTAPVTSSTVDSLGWNAENYNIQDVMQSNKPIKDPTYTPIAISLDSRPSDVPKQMLMASLRAPDVLDALTEQGMWRNYEQFKSRMGTSAVSSFENPGKEQLKLMQANGNTRHFPLAPPKPPTASAAAAVAYEDDSARISNARKQRQRQPLLDHRSRPN
jgi:hypothetical protein